MGHESVYHDPDAAFDEANAEAIADHRLDIEFGYTSHADSCKNLYSPSYYCRRLWGHDGQHAAGFGEHRVRWSS